MKTPSITLLALASAGISLAQGPLTPPPGYDPNVGPANALNGGGLPQPTMKTLHQVEPRTPLAAGQPGVTQNPNGGFTITAPGSYYLTASFGVSTGSGIRVEADYVTLDLNGMNIYSNASPASGAGVEVPFFRKGLTVKNGFIVGLTQVNGTVAPHSYNAGGFTAGILSNVPGPAGTFYGTLVEHMDVRGCAGPGLHVIGGKFFNCIVDGCSGKGIEGATAEACTVGRCGGHGITVDSATHCQVAACTGAGVRATMADKCESAGCTGFGIDGYAIRNCWAYQSGSIGIRGSTITDSRADESLDVGILGEKVSGCIARLSLSTGIQCHVASDCFSDGNEGFGFLLGGDYDEFEVFTNVRSFTATNCVASRNSRGFVLSSGTLTGCSAFENSGDGFYIGLAGNIHACNAANNAGSGINGSGCVLSNSSANNNGMVGIVGNQSVVSNCIAFDNIGTGILANNSSISCCRSLANGGAGNYSPPINDPSSTWLNCR